MLQNDRLNRILGQELIKLIKIADAAGSGMHCKWEKYQ